MTEYKETAVRRKRQRADTRFPDAAIARALSATLCVKEAAEMIGMCRSTLRKRCILSASLKPLWLAARERGKLLAGSARTGVVLKRKRPNETQREKNKANRLRYESRSAIKLAARKEVRRALIAGTIAASPCEVCGSVFAHAHHDDYAQPLKVRWLCATHHKAWHVQNGPGANGEIRRIGLFG